MLSPQLKYMEFIGAFVNTHFTKSQLKKMVERKGIKIKGKKELFVQKVIELYSTPELLECSKILDHLYWYDKLILSALLSGPKTKEEIIKQELTQRILSHGIPKAAFDTIAPGTLTKKEAEAYLSQKINRLRRKHLLIAEKQGKRLIFLIPPWFVFFILQKVAISGKRKKPHGRN